MHGQHLLPLAHADHTHPSLTLIFFSLQKVMGRLTGAQKCWFFSSLFLNATAAYLFSLSTGWRYWPSVDSRILPCLEAAAANAMVGLALSLLSLVVTNTFGWSFLFGSNGAWGPSGSSDDPDKARALSLRRLIARCHRLTSTVSAFVLLPLVVVFGMFFQREANYNLKGPLLEGLGRPQRTAIIGGSPLPFRNLRFYVTALFFLSPWQLALVG